MFVTKSMLSRKLMPSGAEAGIEFHKKWSDLSNWADLIDTGENSLETRITVKLAQQIKDVKEELLFKLLGDEYPKYEQVLNKFIVENLDDLLKKEAGEVSDVRRAELGVEARKKAIQNLKDQLIDDTKEAALTSPNYIGRYAGETLRQVFLTNKKAWDGTNLLKDTISGKLGTAFPKLQAPLNSWSELLQWVRHMFVLAVLGRKPGWLVNNWLESSLRVVLYDGLTGNGIAALGTDLDAVAQNIATPVELFTSLLRPDIPGTALAEKQLKQSAVRNFIENLTQIFRDSATNPKRGNIVNGIFSLWIEKIPYAMAETNRMIEASLRVRLFYKMFADNMHRWENFATPVFRGQIEDGLRAWVDDSGQRKMTDVDIKELADMWESQYITSGNDLFAIEAIRHLKDKNSAFSLWNDPAMLKSFIGNNRGAKRLLIKTLREEWEKFLSEKLKEVGLHELRPEQIVSSRTRWEGEVGARSEGGGGVSKAPRYNEAERNAHIKSFKERKLIGERLASSLQSNGKLGNWSLDDTDEILRAVAGLPPLARRYLEEQFTPNIYSYYSPQDLPEHLDIARLFTSGNADAVYCDGGIYMISGRVGSQTLLHEIVHRVIDDANLGSMLISS
jgi:hypothetical protein